MAELRDPVLKGPDPAVHKVARWRCGDHAVVLCGGAEWHQTGGELTLPPNISLLPIPPYSPEQNPMEIAWDYLRGNRLSHEI